MFRSPFTQFNPAGLGFPGQAARRAVTRAASLAAITVLALGTLSGTAVAQSFITDLRISCYMLTVPQAYGDDADVNSKSGRFTDVSVQTGYPQLNPGGLSGYIEVRYEVKEGASNHTVLQRTDIVPFYAPDGHRMVSAQPALQFPRSPVNWSRRYFGQDHDWHDESLAVVGLTYMRTLYTKIDGPGRDDKGNVAMSAFMLIPVEVVRN